MVKKSKDQLLIIFRGSDSYTDLLISRLYFIYCAANKEKAWTTVNYFRLLNNQ